MKLCSLKVYDRYAWLHQEDLPFYRKCIICENLVLIEKVGHIGSLYVCSEECRRKKARMTKRANKLKRPKYKRDDMYHIQKKDYIRICEDVIAKERSEKW